MTNEQLVERANELNRRIKYAEHDMEMTYGRPSYSAYKAHRDQLKAKLDRLLCTPCTA